jgi:folate-dependent phosphoribosylglycinamide formyltransferase PurN
VGAAVTRASVPVRGTVVLLAGPGDTTDIVAHHLAPLVERLEVIVEQPVDRVRLARRRAARLGWVPVMGQILFVTVALPFLRRRGAARVRSVMADAGLDPSPFPAVHSVPSVNDPRTADLLRSLDPSVVVVNGTRIIAAALLDSIACPVINTHAGITPRYRGVHGGYWALAEGHPERVGTTVHLVDPGIDTGGVLAQAHFDTTRRDTIATYPYLHLAAGLPLLADQVVRILGGTAPTAVADDPLAPSRLYAHPTLWGYLWRWSTRGIR